MARQLRSLINTVLSLAAISLVSGGDAGAQAYPTRPIRLVVPASAGGGLDIMSRAMASKLPASLGQTILVENRAGANGVLGVQAVARAAPDGYTFLIAAPVFLIAPSMMPNAGYDPVRDFTGVSLLGWVPQILVVHPSLQVKSVRELISLAKARPGELNFASAGSGSGAHMAAALFIRQAGISLTHVPYKGDAPALVDLIGGQVLLKFDNMVTALPHVKSGKLRAVGITSPNRSPLLPDVPVIGDTLPGYEASIFNAMFAHASTPREIVARMHGEVVKFVNSPGTKSTFAQQGVELQASPSPEQFTALIKSDFAKWAKVIQEAGIKAE